MDCLATFLEFYERQTALNTLKTLSDAFVCSVWLHSFGRFCLLRVVALFRTLLSALCGCTLSDAFVYSVWLHSFGRFCLLCVVALVRKLLSTPCGCTLSDAFFYSVLLHSFGFLCPPSFGRVCLLCVVSLVLSLTTARSWKSMNADLVRQLL